MKSLREVQKQYLDEQIEVYAREAEHALGFDPRIVDWYHPRLSVLKLRESNAESAFPALLRAGVSTFMFDAYQQVNVIWPDIVHVENSTSFEELYAPLYGAEMPKQVLPGQEFEDSQLKGLDVRVPNLKFGRILGVERELVDDDKTGQIKSRAVGMGERVRYREEKLVMDAILSGGAQGYTTAIGNRPSSGAQLSKAGLEAGTIALQAMVDPLGNLIMVQPDTLLVSPSDQFNADQLVNSTLNPAVPGASGQTASTASAGLTGSLMSKNALQGIYAIKVSRFLPSSVSATKGLDGTNGAWLLLDSNRSVVFQDRDPLEVAQEATNSGQSFSRDVYRYRTRRRAAAAVIDSRLTYRGN